MAKSTKRIRNNHIIECPFCGSDMIEEGRYKFVHYRCATCGTTVSSPLKLKLIKSNKEASK